MDCGCGFGNEVDGTRQNMRRMNSIALREVVITDTGCIRGSLVWLTWRKCALVIVKDVCLLCI